MSNDALGDDTPKNDEEEFNTPEDELRAREREREREGGEREGGREEISKQQQ